MFSILRDRRTEQGFVVGFLSQRQAFGRIYIQPRGDDISLTFTSALDGIELAPGSSFTTDWAWMERIQSGYSHAGDAYFEAVGETNHARRTTKVPTGWCSWYIFFTGVTQQDIDEHLAWSEEHQASLPLDLIQIDDGFQGKVGDWFDRSPGFSDSMGLLAGRIRDSGRQPGIWLAPFLANRRSRLIREHPDWVLRQDNGNPVNPGWGWNGFPRVLDITHPEVIDFIAELVQRVTDDWGFSYLKLDFLYAGALPGTFFNRELTRAQALTAAFRRIREAAGEQVTLIGCGCPLGPGIGVFDGMRIGPDIAPNWKPRLGLLTRWIADDPGLPAARNSIRNAILRSSLNRRWWVNDPDCVLLRSEDSALSESEVESLSSAIALSAGAVIFSDRMMDLSLERLHWGGRVLPPLEIQGGSIWSDQEGSIYTLAVGLEGVTGSWTLLGVFNLSDQAGSWHPGRMKDAVRYEGEVHCVDFWKAEYRSYHLPAQKPWSLPPRSVRCVALRPSQPKPQWLGSTLHISQGQELQSWICEHEEVRAQIGFGGRNLRGKFWAAFPGQLRQATMAGKELTWTMIQPGVYQFDAEIHGVQEARFIWREARP